jgi:3-hydroxyisobutyrate dehydrogenase-like beta-hydroxyacid dehydrogenase
MTVNKIAILSPGDMGHAVGRALSEHGFDILTYLEGRSQRTYALAKDAGFRISATLNELINETDLLLSILVPASAETVAKEIARSLKETGETTLIADCNAISPMRSERIGRIIESAGGRYIDASIIGHPPGRDVPPRFYVSGHYADTMLELDGKGIAVKTLGGDVGRASGIKMCYAALTKGTSTLQVALLTVAESLGLSSELLEELAYSQKAVLRSMESGIPRLPPNAHRWIGEMEEIATTFAAQGVTPNFHLGAAAIYRLLEQTPYAIESPEDIDSNRTLTQTIAATVAQLSECEMENTDDDSGPPGAE